MIDLYTRRRLRSRAVVALSIFAAAVGIFVLVLILGTLLYEGFGGLSLDVFTEMTPPPGAAGGLRNAIVGSLLMTVIGVLICTPIGILGGTYLAEYGRSTKLARGVRFINDGLHSAPSIIFSLSVYEVRVNRTGGRK